MLRATLVDETLTAKKKETNRTALRSGTCRGSTCLA
jgi:hypothetical protein